jgi:hypothetical protein
VIKPIIMYVKWLWWRFRLALGWTLKQVGEKFLGAGWQLINRAAKDYEADFSRYEKKPPHYDPH